MINIYMYTRHKINKTWTRDKKQVYETISLTDWKKTTQVK